MTDLQKSMREIRKMLGFPVALWEINELGNTQTRRQRATKELEKMTTYYETIEQDAIERGAL